MKLECNLAQFVVQANEPLDLKQRPTQVAPLSTSKDHYRDLLAEYREEISKLQGVLYAHNRYAVLLIFQGMDTAGKGGAIKHVMSGVNPQGCQVFSFGPPSVEELDHDFLWRTNKRLPERGRIGIFDRSYYEEVLVVRVKPEILAKQRLPKECVNDPDFWSQRYADIVNLEDYLYRNGTRVIKFFLHLSKEEQRERLLARIDDPDKNWKFSATDLDSRIAWDTYQSAYEKCLGCTSTKQSPWYIVPADQKQNARLIISSIIVEIMSSLDMRYPRADTDHHKMLQNAKQKLRAEVAKSRQ